MLRSICVAILLCIFGGSSGDDVKSNHTMRLELVRQASPLEQIMKYGHKVDKGLLSELQKGRRDNDSIALYRFLDDEFYGKIVIGHPGQELLVSFDTAWSYSWVMSSKCSSIKSIGCWFHHKYDHTKSSEYKKDGRPFAVKVSNFTMSGFYSYDNISIAHSNVTNQSFAEIVTVPNSFIFDKADGVLGLGLKTDDYSPFFYTLLAQNKIKNPLFSIYLNRDRQSNRGGNIMLGFMDDRHVHKSVIKNKTVPDPITYLPVDVGQAQWQFNMDRIIVNDATPKILCQNGCKAVSDTSSNVIYGPKEEVDEIHDIIQAREFFLNRYTVNCDTVNKLPKIDFILGGRNFTLTGPNYVIKMSYHSITLCLSSFIPEEQTMWTLGGAFLSEFYSVYNLQDKTVGFVKAA